MQYPIGCDTTRKRIEYVIRLVELVRRIHILFGLWYRQPITEAQYNNQLSQMPDKIETWVRNNYPYKPQLTKSDWDGFVDIYKSKTVTLLKQRNIHFELLRTVTAWDNDADIGDI